MASYRFAARPSWIAGHVLVLAAAVAMVFLGRWQLHVSESKHFSLQNFGYSLQWWAFSIFAVAFWAKIVHDRAHSHDEQPASHSQPPVGAEPEQVAYRRYVPPTPTTDDDPEIARYNAYLASLAQQDES